MSFQFAEYIISWYLDNKRDLPWRNNGSAYSIWLSEIILQQTRVAQGTPYYLKILKRFPDVFSLAVAKENELLELWQGLGYYSRAKNMQKCAKQVVAQYGGKFPDNYKELLQLSGIGPYTAAAIASIAFGEKVAVVDGNVNRLVSRYIGITEPINEKKGQEKIQFFVNEMIPENNASNYNQAMMEMGALICTPKNPKCDQCVLNLACYSRRHELQSTLPVKVKKVKVKPLTINYFVCENEGGKICIIKRPNQGIWQGLHEFPNLEEFTPSSGEALLGTFKHILTHKKIEAKLWNVRELPEELIQNNSIFQVHKKYIGNKYPIHKLMQKIFIKWQD